MLKTAFFVSFLFSILFNASCVQADPSQQFDQEMEELVSPLHEIIDAIQQKLLEEYDSEDLQVVLRKAVISHKPADLSLRQ